MKNLLFIIIPLLLFSCSNSLDKKYVAENFLLDAQVIREEISQADLELLTMSVFSEQGDEYKGKTYKQILKQAKDYQKEQELLAEKIRIEEEEKRIRLGQTATVSMYDKGFLKYDYDSYITYSFAIENKSDKNIRAMKGILVINDLFDEKIIELTFTFDSEIASGETLKEEYTTKYNKFKDAHKKLLNKEMKDLKTVWTPEKIIFTDGSVLE
ncbi:hypothetical protein N9H19_00870 [Flavobacteriales bacterium]|nr:hypothetical protein [Flavobacteriales bacterium]